MLRSYCGFAGACCWRFSRRCARELCVLELLLYLLTNTASTSQEIMIYPVADLEREGGGGIFEAMEGDENFRPVRVNEVAPPPPTPVAPTAAPIAAPTAPTPLPFAPAPVAKGGPQVPASPTPTTPSAAQITPRTKAMLDMYGLSSSLDTITTFVTTSNVTMPAPAPVPAPVRHQSNSKCLACPQLQRKLLQTVPAVVLEETKSELAQVKADRMLLLKQVNQQSKEAKLVETESAVALRETTAALFLRESELERMERVAEEREEEIRTLQVRPMAGIKTLLRMAGESRNKQAATARSRPAQNPQLARWPFGSHWMSGTPYL